MANILQSIDQSIGQTDMLSLSLITAEFTRALARLEGAFCGFSSGANVCAAVKLLNGEFKGKNIALLLNDSGLKYLTTDLFKS